MTTTTGSGAITTYFEDGEEVYPCRCGETHRGDYGIYDHHRHECYHEWPLDLDWVAGKQVARCPWCQRQWETREVTCELEKGW